MKSTYLNFIKIIVSIIVFTITSETSYATGLTGGQITYRLIDSTSGRYRFTLELYRDCESIAYGNEILNIRTIGVSTTMALTFKGRLEITPIAYPPDVPVAITTNCPNGSIINGIRGHDKWIYEGEYILGKNIGWAYVGWSNCCRNTSISTSSAPWSSIWIQAAINTNHKNSSPTLSEPSMLFWNTGRENYYNVGAYDNIDPRYISINGRMVLRDSFSYELITPFIAEAANANTVVNLQNPSVTMNSGLSAQNFLYTIGGVSLNQKTGIVSATPSINQDAIICYVVKEYRAVPNATNTSYTREYVGHVMREMLQIVSSSSEPVIFEGIVKDSSLVDTLINNYTASTCQLKNKVVFKVKGPAYKKLLIKDLSKIDNTAISNYQMSYTKSIANNIETMLVTITYDRKINAPSIDFLFNLYYVNSSGIIADRFIPIKVQLGTGITNLETDTVYYCSSAPFVRLDATMGTNVKWSPKTNIVAAQAVDSGWIDVNPPTSTWYYANNLSSNQTCKFNDSIYVKKISCDTIFGYLFIDADKNCTYNPWEFPIRRESFTVKGVTNSYNATFTTDSMGYFAFTPPNNNTYTAESVGKMFNCSSNKIKYTFSMNNFRKQVDIPVKDSVVIQGFNAVISDTILCFTDSVQYKLNLFKTFGTLKLVLHYGDGNFKIINYPIEDSAISIIQKYKYAAVGIYSPRVVFYDKLNKAIDSVFLTKVNVQSCLKGQVFIDSSNNCIYDSAVDKYVPYYKLLITNKTTNVTKTVFTDSKGNFKSFFNSYNPYEIKSQYIINCTSGQLIKTIPSLNKDTILNSAIPLDRNSSNYAILVGKVGKISNIKKLRLVLYYDGFNTNHSTIKKYYVTLPGKTFFDSLSSNASKVISGNTLIITQNSGTNAILTLKFDSLIPTDTLCFSVRLEKVLGELDTADNVISFCHKAETAFDPNNKLTGIRSHISQEDYTDKNDYINYQINFQNLGTAPARDIRVEDVIDTKLDLNSLEILSSSHPMEIMLDDNRQIKFYFKNIMLPDSASNEPASHGNINYRLKPISSLNLNEEIKNFADIYFDFNAPVTTNTTISRYVLKSTLGVNSVQSSISIYPNPTKDFLYISMPDNIRQFNLELYSIDGKRLIQTQNTKQIDMRLYPKGMYLLNIESDKLSKQLKIQLDK